ncbi:amidase [Pseudomonas chlororaphis]|uniref:amidase n=1 Tax=Pseudomonas chlororaphis TaxID=587753 RepID=UPI000F54C8ED|nr:amidase [Pseudomonas chlororaphis]AZD46809.1 Amidase family protein [Pseudomonas chlororaphis subsp. aurantiaca]AZD77956.1 Amidase family protein [Pseudomonas chlororaphis subsp. aurantiaca]
MDIAAQDLGPIVELGAVELSRAIHARRFSCREVMLAYLDRIERCNPRVNALVSLRERRVLLAEADERDRQLDRGQSMGWMHGMPQAIKDLAATAGLRTTLGSPLFAEQIPAHDAICVARVRASGAIIVGKSNVPEFGLGSQTYNKVFGTTGNAYDPRLNAGGSSGGAAVALALHMLPVADGSDMMGSLRNPAAFNNVFGLRPSQGRVPHGPVPELFVQQLATEGPMGRSVADIARLLGTQAGYDSRVPLSLKDDPAIFNEPLQRDFRGARLGWLGDFDGYLAMDDGVLALCEAALGDFRQLGCEVEACQPAFSMAALWQCWLVHRHWLVQGNLGPLYADPQKRHLLKPEAQWEVEGGLGLSAAEVYRASQVRSDWYRALERLFERYDFLLLPSAQVFPFDAGVPWPRFVGGREMDTYHRWMEVVIGPTLAGLPSLSVPVGFNPAGLPMGLQIIGPAQADRAVLQLGHAHEQLTQWVRRRPPGHPL